MLSDPFAVPLTDAAFPLILRGIGCARGERVVFSGFDMVVDRGAVCVVRGDNGAGKSSLLRILAGLMRPYGGVMAWGDGQQPHAETERAILIGHQDAVKPALTVAENLAFWAAYANLPASPWPDACDPFVVAPLADLPARALSAGQKRRVGLTRLAFSAAPLWLLDEPLTALDAAGQRAVLAAVAAHRRRGGAAVITTHAPIDLPDITEIDIGEGPLA